MMGLEMNNHTDPLAELIRDGVGSEDGYVPDIFSWTFFLSHA